MLWHNPMSSMSSCKLTDFSNFEQFAKSISIDNKNARYYDLKDLTALKNHSDNQSQINKPTNPRLPAHFYGGNGFAVGVYQPLLSKLASQFDITSLAMRGYWYDLPTAKTLTREQDADMLIEFLQKTQNQPVIGIGHSQGATATAMACAKRPDLFSKLYLIEPVTFTKQQTLVYNLLPRWLKMSQEPFTSTLKKPTTWQSIEDYYQFLRSHRAYKRVSDEHLKIYATNSLEQRDDGQYELIFAPKQELANYFGTPYIDDALKQLNRLNMPYTLILGKPTIFVSDKVRKNWQGLVDDENIVTLAENGHLLPIENPEGCAEVILEDYQK